MKNTMSMEYDGQSRVYVNAVETSKQVQALRRQYLAKDVRAYRHPSSVAGVEKYAGYNVVNIQLKKMRGVVRATQVPANRMSPYIECTVKPGMIGGLSFKRYSNAFIQVTVLDNMKKLNPSAKDNYEEMLDSIYDGVYLYVDHTGRDQFAIYDEGEEKYVLLSGEETKSKKLYKKYVSWDDIETDKNGEKKLRNVKVVYRGVYPMSNGQNKKKQITVFADKGVAGFDAVKMFDELNFGLCTQYDTHKRQAKNLKQIAQASTRLAQCMAPAVEGNRTFDNEGYFMGIYKDEQDGMFYVTDLYAADWLEERLGRKYFRVLPSAVRGMTFQARPHLIKGNSLIVWYKYLNRVMKRFIKERHIPVVYINRNNVSKDEQEAFNKALWSKGKEGDFAGKLIIIRNDDEKRMDDLELFADLNGLKETFDLRTLTGFNVLDSAMEEEEDRNTSCQTSATYALNPKFLGLYTKRVQEMCQDKEEEVLNATSKNVSLQEVCHEGVDYGQLTQKLAPQFLLHLWNPGYKRMIDGVMEGLSNSVCSFNLNVKGTYGVLVPDPGLDFGVKLLGKRIVTTDAPQNAASMNVKNDKTGKTEMVVWEVMAPSLKDGTEGLMNRYPMANLYGQSRVVVVSKEEVIDRAKKKVTDPEDLEVLIEQIRAYAEGIIVVPAEKSLMNKHDGFDYDGDHVCIITEPSWVKLYDSVGSITVDIDAPKARSLENSKWFIDSRCSFTYWLVTVMSPNPPVGKVVSSFQIFGSVLAWLSDNDSEEAIKKSAEIFRLIFKEGGSVNDANSKKKNLDPVAKFATVYHPLDKVLCDDGYHILVDKESAEKCMDNMKFMKFTRENMLLAARDLQAIARFYTETVIDAAKTGVSVEIPYLNEGLSHVRPLSHSERGAYIKWDEKNVSMSDDRRTINKSYGLKKTSDFRRIPDVLHPIREVGFQEVSKMGEKFLTYKQELPQEMIDIIDSESQGYEKEMAVIDNVAQQIYHTFMGMEKAQLKELNRRTDRDEIKAIRSSYNDMIDGVRYMLRYYFETQEAENKEAVNEETLSLRRVAMCLKVAMERAKKNAAEAKKNTRSNAVADQIDSNYQNIMSDFAARILDEEFFRFVLWQGNKNNYGKFYKDEEGKPDEKGKVTQWVSVPVKYADRDFDEAERITFDHGQGRSAKDAAVVVAKDPFLSGDYYVKGKEIHQWFRNLVEMPKTDRDNRKVVLISKYDNDSAKAAKEAIDSCALKTGQEVYFVNWIKKGNERIIDDSLVIKNPNTNAEKPYKEIFRVRCGKEMEGIYSRDFLSGKVAGVVSGYSGGKFTVGILLEDVRSYKRSVSQCRQLADMVELMPTTPKKESKTQSSSGSYVPKTSFFQTYGE